MKIKISVNLFFFLIIRSLKNHPVYIIVINLGILQEEVNLTSIYANLKNTLDVIVASSNAIRFT